MCLITVTHMVHNHLILQVNNTVFMMQTLTLDSSHWIESNSLKRDKDTTEFTTVSSVVIMTFIVLAKNNIEI